MPSKQGFGNSRTPMTKKVSYGSAVHYKNPVKNKKKAASGYDPSANTKRKKFYVDNYEENKDKPGFQEAMNKAFGGKTTMNGKVSTTTFKINK